MKIVLDTNVIISAAISHMGNPAKVVASTSDNEEIQLFLSDDILSEYKEVLSRPKLNISKETQQFIIDTITGTGVIIVPTNSSIPMIDESDRKFYDTAKACNATLVTGNIKHYPTESFIMTPADFVAQIDQSK